MKKIWVVAADSGTAKIYQAKDTNTLVEIHVLEHVEAHMQEHELVSDKPGRTAGPFAYPHNYPKKTSQKLKERNHFAEEIARFLEQAYKDKKVEKLYLIAPPPFMGVLRHTLSTHLSEIIQMEINKDLKGFTAEQIREYLPPVL